ncbi:YolD-like family protein [Paenibacillus gallinarum]|uniref:YolD-like family protein n=1 Tax=Paenibacillus gallinarum TaxID=2762232 RepID=A0ABR8SWI9_9BACL|nr:YolD-like family protein [Paenibacillus gallinarum]MBD7967867.1 YolD-like family protein [Paenibacillus gallinarum]
MSKKLQQNGLFESSRMMLPEHREAYVQHQQKLAPRSRPILDPQAFEEMSRLLAESLMLKEPVTIVLFDEWEDVHLTGTVVKFDQAGRTIRIQDLAGLHDVRMRHIIDVYAN